MTKKVFTKILSSNDVGSTGGHQGGILVPKSETDLLAFLPPLDPKVKNPDAWIECIDEGGKLRKLRFIHYNNKLHVENGTRNEYRITYLTAYFREVGAREGDLLEISRDEERGCYALRVIRPGSELTARQEEKAYRIKIHSGWRRIH